MTHDEKIVEAVARAIAEQIKVDASGLAPAVIAHHITGFEEAARAAITAYQAEAWQDISTAPKDGTYVLGYGPHSSRGHYVDAIHFWRDRWTIEWMEGFGAPTHWQPLPPAPKATP